MLASLDDDAEGVSAFLKGAARSGAEFDLLTSVLGRSSCVWKSIFKSPSMESRLLKIKIKIF